MSRVVLVQLLFSALALVMAGLGLTLTLADFKRVLREPRAALIALVLQMLVLPGCALLMALALQLSPPNAVGLLLLAVAPGSVSCSVYSRVFGGNVALNVSLTGLNTLLSLVTLPAACIWALRHFGSQAGDMQDVSGKLFESMLVLVIPVVVGMIIRAYAPALARRLDRPMGFLSIAVLIGFSAAAIVSEWGALSQAFTQVGMTAIVFNVLSLFVGYASAHLLNLGERDAISVAFQLGVRSAILAIFIAMTALNDTQMALPAAVYSITMVPFGLAFGTWVRYRNAAHEAARPSARDDSGDLKLPA